MARADARGVVAALVLCPLFAAGADAAGIRPPFPVATRARLDLRVVASSGSTPWPWDAQSRSSLDGSRFMADVTAGDDRSGVAYLKGAANWRDADDAADRVAFSIAQGDYYYRRPRGSGALSARVFGDERRYFTGELGTELMEDDVVERFEHRLGVLVDATHGPWGTGYLASSLDEGPDARVLQRASARFSSLHVHAAAAYQHTAPPTGADHAVVQTEAAGHYRRASAVVSFSLSGTDGGLFLPPGSFDTGAFDGTHYLAAAPENSATFAEARVRRIAVGRLWVDVIHRYQGVGAAYVNDLSSLRPGSVTSSTGLYASHRRHALDARLVFRDESRFVLENSRRRTVEATARAFIIDNSQMLIRAAAERREFHGREESDAGFVQAAYRRELQGFMGGIHAMVDGIGEDAAVKTGVEARVNWSPTSALYARWIVTDRAGRTDALYARFEFRPTARAWVTLAYGWSGIGDSPYVLDDRDDLAREPRRGDPVGTGGLLMGARSPRAPVLALVVLVSAIGPAPAPGAVRVDGDEVIFSIRAPGATEVYLVGDFNQWNATVEPMNRLDDRFEVGLFLVAGKYRYKFVVDGNTIVDPDNPGRSPEKGSPLALVERSGGLILSTDLPDEDTGAVGGVEHGARYIGSLVTEDGETDRTQRVDALVSAAIQRLRARAYIASHDSSWSRIDAFFDRGFVEAGFRGVTVRAFENDSTWSSSDPGFRRHGISATAASSHVSLRGLYADETSRRPSPAPPVADLGGFAAGTGADTTAYATLGSFDGADLAAVGTSVSAGSLSLGYTRRDERGANRGTLVHVTRAGTDFRTERYATREDRTASVLWGSWALRSRLRATAAYGWGSSTAHAWAGETETGAAPSASFTGTGTKLDATFPVGETDRGIVVLETTRERANASLRWDQTRFDFDGVTGRSRAEIYRATLRATGGWKRWIFGVSAEYTRARYGETPDALHVDWPEHNVWLSLWDAFDPERLAAASLDDHTVVRAGAETRRDRLAAAIDLAGVMEEAVRSLTQASARASFEWTIAGPWRAVADARVAWYDGAGTFEAFYVEAGYRVRWFEANAGFGFDPVVFDPVISDYADIGREEFLRGALDGGYARSRSSAISQGLLARERALEDVRAIKVEVIVRLP